MSLEVVFLGTGTSAGIPMIGCDCAVCTSDDPRDTRHRASVLVRYPDAALGDAADPLLQPPNYLGRQVLIDTAPELRLAATRHHLHRLDAVMYTHAHADHILGIDDLRRFNAVMDRALPIYAEQEVLDRLAIMFQYIFAPHRNVNKSFVATLDPHPLLPDEAVTLYGAKWTPMRLIHGKLPIIGFRVDRGDRSLAYCTDVSAIPPQTYPLLQELDVLVIDALRFREHPTHMTVEQALSVIDRIGCKRAYLTHLAHDVKHSELAAQLPEHVEPAYDGLAVTV